MKQNESHDFNFLQELIFHNPDLTTNMKFFYLAYDEFGTLSDELLSISQQVIDVLWTPKYRNFACIYLPMSPHILAYLENRREMNLDINKWMIEH